MKTCSKCGVEKPLSDFYVQADCALGVRPDCKVCVRTARQAERDDHPERVAARERRRYERHSEKIKAKTRAWYKANRDEALKYRNLHYAANREVYAAYSAKRKAIKRTVEHQHYTRREIYDRDNGTCKICGTELPYEPNGFHLDHIVPLALGGPDTPANLQLACQACNREKWMTLEGQIHLPV